jgi:hypothetical protein
MDPVDLALAVESVGLDEDDQQKSDVEVSLKRSQLKRKTLEEIKSLTGLRDNPTVSFVIIGWRPLCF